MRLKIAVSAVRFRPVPHVLFESIKAVKALITSDLAAFFICINIFVREARGNQKWNNGTVSFLKQRDKYMASLQKRGRYYYGRWRSNVITTEITILPG